jgi:arylsulfatase A-like enzyme
MDGTSLWPVMTGADRAWKRPVLLEALWGLARTSPGFPPRLSQFGVRTGRYKYVRYSNGAEEFYDLRTDPNELTGRQRDPAYADVKARMVAVWKQYAACRGAACLAPLPADLQVNGATLRVTESNARRAWNQYYNR